MKHVLHGRLGITALWLLAAGALVAGATLLLDASYSSSRHTLPASTVTTESTSVTTTSFDGTSRPVRLSVPILNISAKVVQLGLNRNGTVQVPSNVRDTGWYRWGPTPGQIGSAVILGHVDSFRGPGVFFRLRDLAKGNHVVVTLANGRAVTFRVTAVRTYSKTRFPAHLVYGSHGSRALQLVTCGGKFNSTTGSYESNVVVFSIRL